MNSHPVDKRAQCNAMLLAGESIASISRALGVPKTTISYWKKTIDVSILKEKIGQALEKGEDVSELQLECVLPEEPSIAEKTAEFFHSYLDSWVTMAQLLQDPEFLRANPTVALQYHQFLSDRADGLADRLEGNLRETPETGRQEVLSPDDPRIPRAS